MRLKLLFTAFCALAVTVASAQSVDEIIANYFENTGGVDNWKKLETIKMVGTVPSPQGDFPFIMYSAKPNKFKVEIDFQGVVMIPQAYDGTTAWRLMPFTGETNAVKFTDEETKEFADQAEFEPLYMNYKEKGHEISLDGTEEVDGVECFKLVVNRNKNNEKDQSVEYHFFDTENFVPIMTRTTAKTGPAKGMETETYLSDYQETDAGVIMPFYMESRTGDFPAQKIITKTITFNEKFEDSVFAFPEKSEEENK